MTTLSRTKFMLYSGVLATGQLGDEPGHDDNVNHIFASEH